MRYKYTSFFWSKSEVGIFLRTSGNNADTSLPNVIAMIVFWIASFLCGIQQAVFKANNGSSDTSRRHTEIYLV